MINKFQKRGLGILRDIPQIDPLRIPDQVELTDFTGVDFDFVQNCAQFKWETLKRVFTVGSMVTGLQKRVHLLRDHLPMARLPSS